MKSVFFPDFLWGKARGGPWNMLCHLHDERSRACLGRNGASLEVKSTESFFHCTKRTHSERSIIPVLWKAQRHLQPNLQSFFSCTISTFYTSSMVALMCGEFANSKIMEDDP